MFELKQHISYLFKGFSKLIVLADTSILNKMGKLYSKIPFFEITQCDSQYNMIKNIRHMLRNKI